MSENQYLECRELLDAAKQRAEQAEQQRDAAHAALREIRQYADENYNDLSGGAIMSLADAALAASAPQKDQL